MARCILLAAAALPLLASAAAAEPSWRDYWGDRETNTYQEMSGGWQLYGIDTGCLVLAGDDDRWMLLRMDRGRDLLDLSLGGAETSAFGDPFEELPDGGEDSSLYLKFGDSTEFRAEISSWEIEEYGVELPLGMARPLFEIGGSLTARRDSPAHSVTFPLEGAAMGLMLLEGCERFSESMSILKQHQ